MDCSENFCAPSWRQEMPTELKFGPIGLIGSDLFEKGLFEPTAFLSKDSGSKPILSCSWWLGKLVGSGTRRDPSSQFWTTDMFLRDTWKFGLVLEKRVSLRHYVTKWSDRVKIATDPESTHWALSYEVLHDMVPTVLEIGLGFNRCILHKNLQFLPHNFVKWRPIWTKSTFLESSY